MDLPAALARERGIARTRRVRQSTGGGAPWLYYHALALYYREKNLTPLPRHGFGGKLTDAQPLLGGAPLTASGTGHGAVRAPGYKLSMHFRGRGREWCIVRVVLGCFSAPDVASSPSTWFVMFSL